METPKQVETIPTINQNVLDVKHYLAVSVITPPEPGVLPSLERRGQSQSGQKPWSNKIESGFGLPTSL